MADKKLVGGYPNGQCNACGVTLKPENARVVDGCPCNSGRGVNDLAIDEIVDCLGYGLPGPTRAKIGLVIDRIRSGELGPLLDGNSEEMRDQREAAWRVVLEKRVPTEGK